MIHSFIALFILVVLSSCTAYYPAFSGGSLRELELKRQGYRAVGLSSYGDDRRYWNKVSLGGKEVRLLLDSGANSTDIDKATADRIGLVRNAHYQVVSKGALGREIRSKLGLTELRYGTQSVYPFTVVVSEGAKQATSVGKYDGQIGIDGLVESAALVDLSAMKVWMPRDDVKNEKNYPIVGRNPQLGYDAVSLYSDGKYAHLVLSGTCNGKYVNWIVDTGAEVSILDSSSARRLGLSVVQTRSRMIDISGDTSELGYALAEGVQFGKTRLAQLPVAVADIGYVRNAFRLPNGTRVDGILGVDFLQSTQALLDPRSKVIHLGVAEDHSR